MTRSSPDRLTLVRGVLLATLWLGLAGTGVELVLLEHTDGPWQLEPLVLIALGLIALGWHAVNRSAASLGLLRGIMVLFLASGLAGVVLHYRGNVEFELEMSPALRGWELFKKAMMGATPALAPGTMIQLGLLGLAYAFAAGRAASPPATNSHAKD